jgi:hypothetical protein
MITKFGQYVLIAQALRDFLRQRNVIVSDYGHWLEIERKRHTIQISLNSTVDRTDSFRVIAVRRDNSVLRGTRIGLYTNNSSEQTSNMVSSFHDPGCFQEIFEFVMSKKHK